MSVKLRKEEHIFLIESTKTQILGSKLSLLNQMFQLLFFNLRTLNFNIHQSANMVI